MKVEGRIKGAPYVYTIVDTWRRQIDQFIASGKISGDDASLYKVFNRDFSNAFLTGQLTKQMFIDNPRDNSFKYANEKHNAISVMQIEQVQQNLAQEKNAITALVADRTKHLSVAKTQLTMTFSGSSDEPLTMTVKEGERCFTVNSEVLLTAADNFAIDPAAIEKRFKSFKNSGYDLLPLIFDDLDSGLSLPFKELTILKNKVAFLLNDSSEPLPPVTLAVPKLHAKKQHLPGLSVLISDKKDLHLCDVTDADIYFKLPESFKKNCAEFIELFLQNPRLIPWFPAVLIGKDYLQAVKILQQVKPRCIVTNNSGIAYQAAELNIDWIAGPFLNTTNSYALLTLQKGLNCAGAFISNEINREQIKNIRRPENFKLLYSIYHPIVMMTSRACFFQQTVGCNKVSIDESCMIRCEKATTITNLNGISFAVDKQKGGYPCIYNEQPFLNVDAVTDLSDLFDGFFIDLSNIGAGLQAELDKAVLIKHFENLLAGSKDTKFQLAQILGNSTNAQYIRGL